MPRRGDDVEIKAVAVLYAEQGMTRQRSIAAKLGIAESQVAKHLKKARSLGWIKSRPELVLSMTPQERSVVDARTNSIEFQSRLSQFARQVGVRPVSMVRMFPTGDNDSNWARRLNEFGESAARTVYDLLAHGRVVGAAWGVTPAAVVQGIRAHSFPKIRSGARFFPLCGEPLSDDLIETSASQIASDLAVLVRGASRYARSLHNVPALIPGDFNQTERDAIYKLLSRTPAYCEIFGPPGKGERSEPRLVDSADTVLTSVSAEGAPWGSRNQGLQLSAGLSTDEMNQFCLGDIGGVLLPSPRQEGRTDQLMRNWTGVQLTDLERIAERGRIIVIAIGANKARVLFEVLKRGLCTHLLIDGDLLNALNTLVFDSVSLHRRRD